MVRGPIDCMVWNIEMCIRDQNAGIDTIEYVSLIPWVCNMSYENCRLGWGKVPRIDYIWTSKFKNKLQDITISTKYNGKAVAKNTHENLQC